MLLRYFGSKKKTGRDIMTYAPSSFSAYVEPFCGSANMLWHVPTAVDRWINDLNSDVVAFHLALRDDPTFLDRLFEYAKIKTASELRNAFYRAKWKWYKTGCPISFWLLNRYSLGRLVRRCRNDLASFDATYLVPGMRFPFSREEAERAREIMQGVTITCLDYREVLDHVPDDSWTFLDPPYHTDENLYDCQLTFEDHYELRDRLHAFQHRFFMTNGLTELSHRLYLQERNGFDIREHHYSTMNLIKGGSLPSVELYVRNYLNF